MVVLITGVTGGLGGVLGRMLVEKGMTVYGTTRRPEGRENDFPFPLLQIDVTSDSSVAACVNSLVDKEGRIDVLINCVNENLSKISDDLLFFLLVFVICKFIPYVH